MSTVSRSVLSHGGEVGVAGIDSRKSVDRAAELRRRSEKRIASARRWCLDQTSVWSGEFFHDHTKPQQSGESPCQ